MSNVFDQLKERVKDQRREQGRQWYAQQPRQPVVMPPPVIIRSQPQPTPQQPEQPVAEMGQPVHRTHKPLLVAIISIAVIGAIVSLLLWGPQFVGQAIAGAPPLAPPLEPGMAGTWFAERAVEGQQAQVLLGVNPSGPSYGCEARLRMEQLQLVDADGDGFTAADLSPDASLSGWRIDADVSDGLTIRTYNPLLQPMQGPFQIGIPVMVIAVGGRATIDGIRCGYPDSLITTMESRAVVEAAPAAAEEQPRPAQRRVVRKPRPPQFGQPGQGAAQPAAAGRQPEVDCSNTLDDDSDGQIDCQDTDCLGKPECPGPAVGEGRVAGGSVVHQGGWKEQFASREALEEWIENCKMGACAELCGDGFDNDGDGTQDCADADCVANSKCAVGDDDHDGVPNDVDLCAGSLAEDVRLGLIYFTGCPVATGGDNCVDQIDYDRVLANFNVECSTDADSDGIADAQDDDVDGDGPANAQDTDDDNDGILDEADLCPFTPLGKSVEAATGCLVGDVVDVLNEKEGPDNCVNEADLDFIRNKINPEFRCENGR